MIHNELVWRFLFLAELLTLYGLGVAILLEWAGQRGKRG
jgi:hypothetical protein